MSSGNKFARPTGRGQFRPPPNRGIVRLRHGQAPSKRGLLGQGKDATGSISAGSGGNASISKEESFQLMPHPSTAGPPFAMVIRLQPEILEELKQAEAEGIEPLMKFGTNTLGHVIQVGSETFKFSSAPEPGDLCDIYEHRKGESGEAVLVEAGSAWRKLSVLRSLSATEKDRVKKRTAEAEKKQRERKSILVDPNTQMIIPQAPTAEANGRKPLPKLPKEPPPKKRKVVTMSPIKQNIHTSSTVMSGNHQFSSPASPSFEPPVIQARGSHTNQMADLHPVKGHAVPERTIPPLANKGPALQKEKTRTPAPLARHDIGKSGPATNMTDLRGFLIALLQENPKGVTIKAIEKAVSESFSAVPEKKALDKVMKSIASFHAPGKYLLNPGVENGNFSDSVQPIVSARGQDALRSSIREEEPLVSIPEREAVKEKMEPTSYDRGQSNVLHHAEHSTKEPSPELVNTELFDASIPQENPSKPNAAHVFKDPSTGGSESSSSSGSGSASDSDTDSSGSGSGTESGSGSGSDSASSSSSGASMDEDVDIMSDDDVEKKSDAKQKPKVRESKLAAKEDVKLLEKIDHKDKGYENAIPLPLNGSEPVPTLDQAKNQAPDARAKVSENIIESVFGPDEVSDLAAHDNLVERARAEPSSHIKSANANRGDRKISAKTQNSRESRERNTYDEAQRSATRDSEALRIEEELDVLVDKVSESKEMDNSSLVGSKLGFSSAQQEHHKQPMRSAGLGFTKDTDKKRADAECISRPNVERRERDVYDSRWASRNLSSNVELSKVLPEESPMDLGDHLQNAPKAPLDMPKQSPVKVNNDSRHYPYDSRSGKRRPEDIENAETERSRKRAGAAHVKQPPRKEEWQLGPVKQNHTEKGRFSASNSQEYPSIRSDEEMEELYRRPTKISQTLASSSEFRRDHIKAGDSIDNIKRQTPQSNDEAEECGFFAPYEKKKPELRGSINTFQEYKEYCKEYREKYPIYIQLNDAIEQHQKSFDSLRKDMERAKSKDDEKKLMHIRGKIKREYTLHHKKRRRMFDTFRVLHEELKVIKTRCKEYAEKVGQG